MPPRSSPRRVTLVSGLLLATVSATTGAIIAQPWAAMADPGMAAVPPMSQEVDPPSVEPGPADTGGGGSVPPPPQPGTAHARTPRHRSAGLPPRGSSRLPGSLHPRRSSSRRRSRHRPGTPDPWPRRPATPGPWRRRRKTPDPWPRRPGTPGPWRRRTCHGPTRPRGSSPLRNPPGTPRPRPRTRSPPRHRTRTPRPRRPPAPPSRPRPARLRRPSRRTSRTRPPEHHAETRAKPDRHGQAHDLATDRSQALETPGDQDRPGTPAHRHASAADRPQTAPAGAGAAVRVQPDRHPRSHRLRRAGRRRPGSRDVHVLGSGAPDRHSHAAAERILHGFLPDRERRRLLEPRPLAQPYPRGA